MNTLLGLCVRPAGDLRQLWWALPTSALARRLRPLAITPAGAYCGQPAYETDLLYLACLIALVLGGSGPFSLESILLKLPSSNERQERRPPCGCET